jgi:hypothetical protein
MMTIGMNSPRKELPKAPMATATMATKATTMVVVTMAVTMVEIMATKTPSDCIRCVVELAVNPSRISTRRPTNVSKPWEAMKQRIEDLRRVAEDDYKFLNRNVHKLFGMVGNMRGKWCNTCLKYH